MKNMCSSNRFYGISLQILSTICFAFTTLLCKLGYMYNDNLTGFDYLLIRSTSMCVISAIQVIYLRLNVLDVPKEDRINLFIRCMLGAIAMPTYSYGLKYIPATVAALVFNISPILVTILAIIFLHEHFTKIKILIVLGAFVGVILFLSGKDTKNPEHSDYFLGILCCSVSCVLGSFVTVMIRRANKIVHYALSPFYFGVLTYIEAMFLLVFIPSVYNFKHYTFFGVAMFLLSGIFNYAGQTLKSASLKFEDASVVSPFSYFQVVYLFIADIIIFSYSFSSTDIIGASIISVCLLGPEVYTMISYFKAKKQAL